MKILFTNATSVKGGAARAAHRVFSAIKGLGADITYLVEKKLDFQDDILDMKHHFLHEKYLKVIYRLEQRKIRLHRKPATRFWSTAELNRFHLSALLRHKPDIVHLNWVNDTFLSIDEIARIKVPVVWTFHDMWAFTGGCHYAGDCKNYTKGCGNCPLLLKPSLYDISRLSFLKKLKSWNNIDLTLVCPSNWMADMARESEMFRNHRIEVIPNPVNIELYKSMRNSTPDIKKPFKPGKIKLLFGAVNSLSDERKGGKLLLEILKIIKNQSSGIISKENIELLVFGADKSEEIDALSFDTRYMGYVKDEKVLSEIYAAADLFLVTSKEDNLPNTVMESLACSTPVVAFDVGGISDMVEHKVNGYLAKSFNVVDYVNGIKYLLNSDGHQRLSEFSDNARRKIETAFAEEIVSKKHMDLYNDLVKI
ncbi:glycosyltransferase [Marinilabiliaceae bacterium JC017]|nr:glycosyltransferase [Marinilabiliaceae bacterium JC017]